MKPLLEPIKPKSVSDQAFEQVKELILRRHFSPGQKFIPERELALALNVSRASVREAIKKLVHMGFLEQRHGQGTFVRSLEYMEENPLVELIKTQDASLKDLLEVRLALECRGAVFAAQRAVERDIRFLEQRLKETEEEIKSGRLGTDADVAFHMAIALTTKNPIYIQMMNNLYDYLFMGIYKALQCIYEERENVQIIQNQHTEIFKAIRNHDSKGAYAAMERHIYFVLDFLDHENKL